MAQAETPEATEQGNGAWTDALDQKMQGVVRSCVPPRLFDDAFQHARLAVVEAEPGRPDAFYIRCGAWAARNYARRERSGKVRPFSTESGGAISLNERGEDGHLLSETIEGKGSEPTVDSDTLRASLSDFLSSIVSPQERRVLELRYGLRDGGRSHTLREVGIVCGVTGEAVRLIQTEALRKLRTALMRNGVDE